MKTTLYELTEDFLRLYEMADECDLAPEDIADTLESLQYELEEKADGYAMVMRQLEGDMALLKAEIDRLSGRKKTVENNIKRMKQGLETAMRAANKPKIKTKLFSFGIQKNPPSVVMDEQYIENIPDEYLIPQDPKIDKKKIKEDLKAGVNLEGLAHLEQTEGLRIR